MAAASKLVENNIEDFLLLEAQEEAGGRIKTVQIRNKPIDLGAQWMHGKSNPLYQLAKENQLISGRFSLEEFVCPNCVIKHDFQTKCPRKGWAST